MAGTVIEISVRFRLCHEDDLPALEWMGLHTREREIIAAAFAAQQRGKGLMLLADAGGFPVGQVWMDFAGRGSAARPYLWAVRVFPPLQGAGLGRRLMAEAEARAAARGATSVDLGVERDNPAAHRFYRRLGYRPAGSRREPLHHVGDSQARDTGTDLHILRKDLDRVPERHGTATATAAGVARTREE